MSEHSGWCVLELCEKIFDMENLSKPIGQPFKNLLTIFTKQVYTVDQLDMVLNQQHGQRPEGHAQSSSSNTGVRPEEDVAMSN